MKRPWCIPGLVEDGKTRQGRAGRGRKSRAASQLRYLDRYAFRHNIREARRKIKKALESRIPRFRHAAISHVC